MQLNVIYMIRFDIQKFWWHLQKPADLDRKQVVENLTLINLGNTTVTTKQKIVDTQWKKALNLHPWTEIQSNGNKCCLHAFLSDGGLNRKDKTKSAHQTSQLP